jgi:hypothetical protein
MNPKTHKASHIIARVISSIYLCVSRCPYALHVARGLNNKRKKEKMPRTPEQKTQRN